jgi:electron transport complex protein RnfG
MSTVAEPGYRKRVGYQAGLLGGFATLAAALLILGNNSTHEAITERQAEDLLESLSQVLPDSLHDNELLGDAIIFEDANGDPLTIYRAMKDQRLTGFAYRATAQGYAGEIELLLGVRPNGELLGVRVLSHSETPGLGDKIEVRKNGWILDFTGRSLRNTAEAEWAVKKDGGQFDQFSGATITPRAVVRAIHESLTFFEANRNELAVMHNNEEVPEKAGEEAQ